MNETFEDDFGDDEEEGNEEDEEDLGFEDEF